MKALKFQKFLGVYAPRSLQRKIPGGFWKHDSHYMYEDLLKELLMLTLEQTCFIANVTANIANVISVWGPYPWFNNIDSLFTILLPPGTKICYFYFILVVYSGPTPMLSILSKGNEQQVHALPQKQKYLQEIRIM